MAAVLDRQVFETSRTLEFFSRKELQMQIGHDLHVWPIALLKELIDNALDACERTDRPAEICVRYDDDSLIIEDNGPGIPPHVVERSLDYMTRTSDKNHYVAPTRGQLGNALKCIYAAPFVASNSVQSKIAIHAGDTLHTITVSVDPIRQAPIIEHDQIRTIVKTGTFIKLHWPGVASYLSGEKFVGFYNSPPIAAQLVRDYAMFNPHVRFGLHDGYAGDTFAPTDVNWRKWLTNSPTSPHWYTCDKMRGLIAAYISAGNDKTVREFVSEFSGLAGSAKQKKVCQAAGLERSRLMDLVIDGDIDMALVRELLEAMCAESREIKPKSLGIIGEQHIVKHLVAQGVTADSIMYRKKEGTTDDGIPFVLEMAFGVFEDTEMAFSLHSGLNWTPAIRTPFDDLFSAFRQYMVDDDDPVCLVVHLASPVLEFMDRGKSRLDLDPAVKSALEDVAKILHKWEKLKRAKIREEKSYQRNLEELSKKDEPEEIDIIDACRTTVIEALDKASSSGKYPANARQVMYAARPLVFELAGKFYKNDASYTQTFLPDWLNENPEAAAKYDVVYDIRGHMSEPHNGRSVGLGTVDTRDYVKSHFPKHDGFLTNRDGDYDPGFDYSAVLFIEKEGFNALLDASGIAQEFDIAFMSTKGQSVTSARFMIEELSKRGVTTFALRDFDKVGFEITYNLRNDNRRYQFDEEPLVIDLGLRLDDIEYMGLDGEPVSYGKTDPTESLRRCGATDDEIEYLAEPIYSRYSRDIVTEWRGKRVELNAMSSEQFIAFIRRKLIEHDVKKVIPGVNVLSKEYKTRWQKMEVSRRSGEFMQRLNREVASVEIHIPEDLEEQIHEKCKAGEYSLQWNDAVDSVLRKSPPNPRCSAYRNVALQSACR